MKKRENNPQRNTGAVSSTPELGKRLRNYQITCLVHTVNDKCVYKANDE